ncbi:acylneuraminate cytidylyltransferase family protein [Methylobacillus gramineus]|uniref:acylneuraminate cytidylyltransferase family protein n=1 Tax=Methylobacillus gramineus TaxID=755169 RepID=UPI001CFFA9DB|nr:acylneuraminate cytidylyltransferase family protein [Methylobacillus gramineus]MCB5184112.1 acylneuraminate cytidylyltransferase family protein [Methylobacillus gramineus]
MSNSENKIYALIPARGGSKGVPRKNLKSIAGFPLISYTIKAAMQAKHVDAVYVSSDCEDILEYSTAQGCTCIVRPPEYATDEASASDVVKHFIKIVNVDDEDLIVYLQPTSPLRDEHHIDDALRILKKTGFTSLVSLEALHKSPYKSFRLDENEQLISLFDEKLSNVRRQNLPLCYAPNGAIYIFSKSEFEARGGFPSNGSVAYVMSAEESVDIDTEADFLETEALLRNKYGIF